MKPSHSHLTSCLTLILGSLLLILSCSSPTPGPLRPPVSGSETLELPGPAPFRIQDIPPATARLEALVFDESNRQLTPQPIVLQKGQVNNLSSIPTGSNRKIIVRAFDAQTRVIAYGEKAGINVLPGEGTPTQAIRLSTLELKGLQQKADGTYVLDMGAQDFRKRLSLKNTGDYPLPWRVRHLSNNALWLGGENLNGGQLWNGTLNGSGSDTLNLNVERRGLSFGIHTGQLEISSDKIYPKLLLDVSMEVGDGSQGGGPSNIRGAIQGKVISLDTRQPIANATITVAITENDVLTTQTDASGSFSLGSIPEGTRVVVVSAQAKSTRLEVTVVGGETRDLGTIGLNTYNGPTLNQKPVIQITQPATLRGNVVNTNSPIITIAGRIDFIDTESREAIISINGEQAKVGVNNDGTFSYVAVLTRAGLNKIFVTAINSLGATRSDTIEVTYQRERIDIHARLTWDRNFNDIDLHVLDPDGNHTYFGNKTGIPDSQLDVDDVNGYGPENFTMLHIPSDRPGRYKVGVVYYSEHEISPPDTKCIVDIILREGTNQEITRRFERTLRDDVGGSDFPDASNQSIWRVADIIVSPNGEMEVTEPND